MTPFEFFFILLFLLFAAFLSLSEIALIGISKIRLRHMAERGVPGAHTAEKLIPQMDQVIATILVCSSFINAALTGLVTAACITWWGEGWGVAAAALVAGTLILLVADIIPRVYAARFSEQVIVRVARPMSVLVRIFRPLSGSVSKLTYAAFRLFGVSLSARSPLVTEEELKMMIEIGKEEGFLGEHERMMLHRIFEFGDLKVQDVMIPLGEIACVPEGATHDDVLTVLTEKGHSRIPVYRDSPNKIVGVIHAQELLHLWREGWLIVLQDLIHPPFEVSPQMRVTELLKEFQRRRVQIAIVVDAGKTAQGLVTLEDLVEEIVGEIHQEQ